MLFDPVKHYVAQATDQGCGQASIAMLLRCSFEEAVALVGHSRGTNTKTLVAALRKAGRVVQWPTLQPGVPVDAEAIVKVRQLGRVRDWHWVFWDGTTPWDPDPRSGGRMRVEVYGFGALLSSHIQVLPLVKG